MVEADRGREAPTGSSRADTWLAAVVHRHTAPYTRPEFLKAVRALSSRYVESRARLPSRSPIDTAGKRAAFAGFYAPLHFLTVRAVIQALDSRSAPTKLVDLGCGTGVASAAWAVSISAAPAIVGIDQNAWVLDEMRWNCRELGLRCRTRRTSMDSWLASEVAPPRSYFHGTGIVCGWSLNELPGDEIDRTMEYLLAAHARSASVLVVEPLALSAVPWWSRWLPRITNAGGRADEWRFPANLPQDLAQLDDAAGFSRDSLSARSIWLPSEQPPGRR